MLERRAGPARLLAGPPRPRGDALRRHDGSHRRRESWEAAGHASDSFLNRIDEAKLENGPELGPGLAPYGKEILNLPVPAFFGAKVSPIRHLIDFGKEQGKLGTGIHMGNGFVLTARHVCDYPESLRTAPMEAFVGKADYSVFVPGAVLRVAPKKGALPETFQFPMSFPPEKFGQHNDWALLELPDQTSSEGAVLRRTSTMKQGDPVYVVGDNTNGLFRVSAGTLGEIVGGNARLENTWVEGGFSGSPAFDAAGNVVGIVYQREGDHAQIITTDAILAELAAARRTAPSLPDLDPASPSHTPETRVRKSGPSQETSQVVDR